MRINIIGWAMLVLGAVAVLVGKNDTGFFCVIFGKLCFMHDDIEKIKGANHE